MKTASGKPPQSYGLFLRNYGGVFLIVLLLCAGTGALLDPPGTWLETVVPVLFIGFITLVAASLVFRDLKKSNVSFMKMLLIGTMLKLLLSLAFILLMVLTFDVRRLVFVGCYFFGYLVFTTFEVYALLNNLQANSRDPDRI